MGADVGAFVGAFVGADVGAFAGIGVTFVILKAPTWLPSKTVQSQLELVRLSITALVS